MFFTFRVYDIQSTFSISASCNNFRTKDTLSNFKITLLFPFFDDQMSGIYFNSNKPIDNEPPNIKNNSKNPTNKSINYVIRNIAYNHSNKDSSKNPIKSIQHNSVKLWLKDLFHYCNFSRLNTHPKDMEKREKIKSIKSFKNQNQNYLRLVKGKVIITIKITYTREIPRETQREVSIFCKNTITIK